MLVLSRKEGEKVLVGEDIRITVVRVTPKSVRLGIEAPPHFSIVREELLISEDSEKDSSTPSRPEKPMKSS